MMPPSPFLYPFCSPKGDPLWANRCYAWQYYLPKIGYYKTELHMLCSTTHHVARYLLAGKEASENGPSVSTTGQLETRGSLL
jgi:hypothetical protein